MGLHIRNRYAPARPFVGIGTQLTDTQVRETPTFLGGGSEEDRLAAAHFIAGAVFLVVGGALQLVSLLSLRFPDLVLLSFGRLEPMANLALMVGFGGLSLFGGVYYVLPRLTGTRLRNSAIASVAFVVTAGLVLLGLLAILFGFGDGSQPLGIPWWLDLPLLAVLVVPALVALSTIRNREETQSYVTLWFAVGGLIWLPLLYATHLITEIPALRSVARAYAEALFSAGYVTMFLITVATGLLYYTVVRELDRPLASRQLALVGFWSLGFAAAWWGAAQLIFGPGPDWVAGVTAALGLAFPIGAIANATNMSLSLDGAWADLNEHPGVQTGIHGLYLTVGLSALVALGGFRSIAAVVAGTSFWEAIEYVAVGGIGLLLIAGSVFAALPRLTGRQLVSPANARQFQRLAVGGTVGVLVALGAAGVMAGYSWIAGSNAAAYTDAGEGWEAGLGNTHATLTLIAILFGVVLFLGQLLYTSILVATLTRGAAIPQEVVVELDDEGEETSDE